MHIKSKSVLDLVMECTKEAHINKLEWLKTFNMKSLKACIIKIADRYCNTVDFIDAGKFKYAMWYKLQAYPVYQAFLEHPDIHLLDEKVNHAIRKDIYAFSQDIHKLFGVNLLYLESPLGHFKEEAKKAEKVLKQGIKK